MQVFQTQPNTRMSKASGNTRLLTPKQRQIDKARNEYNQIVSSSLVDASLSYFSEQTGALVMKGHHSCKEFRGAKKKGIMTSSYLEGAFKDDPQVRAEFMNLVNGDRYEG